MIVAVAGTRLLPGPVRRTALDGDFMTSMGSHSREYDRCKRWEFGQQRQITRLAPALGRWSWVKQLLPNLKFAVVS
jgi:hypothetical protein